MSVFENIFVNNIQITPQIKDHLGLPVGVLPHPSFANLSLCNSVCRDDQRLDSKRRDFIPIHVSDVTKKRYITGNSASIVLQFYDDCSGWRDKRVNSKESRISEAKRFFCSFGTQPSRVSIFICSLRQLSQLHIMLLHPLFMLSQHAPLQPAYNYQSKSERCEKIIIYLLYSLVPIGILIVIGIELSLWGFARIGYALVCSGFICLGLSVLFVFSMLFW